MLNLYYKLSQYISKYKEIVIEEMTEPINMSIEESHTHTDLIIKCSRGDEAARTYVIDKIKAILKLNVSVDDITDMQEIINSELNMYNNNEYTIFNIKDLNNHLNECKISYYQCVNLFATKNQLKNMKLNSNSIDVLSELTYKKFYGTYYLDDLINMKLNNIEVHGTRKIRVEGCNGIWYTLDNYSFENEKDIKNIARRLLDQEIGGDLTDEECEKEGKLLNEARLTIALTPASAENTIFIKKFDSFNPSESQLLENKTITVEMLKDLRIITKGRGNIVITGGVNVGKSTFSKVFIGLYPKNYKIGILDSAKDMDIRGMYMDRDIITLFETEKYTLNDQFKKLLRMNRHILMISEARSYEVEQMLKAMTRGNSGSFCTLHGIDAYSIVDNIAYMCLENGLQQDLRILRNRVANALDYVIRLRHNEETGERFVDEIVEITPTNELNNPFTLSYLYKYNADKGIVERNIHYNVSERLEEKLRYYGCSKKDIATLNGVGE